MFSLEDITKIYLNQVSTLTLKISQLEKELEHKIWWCDYKQEKIDKLEASLKDSNV